MEKFGSCVWICENFLFWWGIEFFLFFFILCVSGSGTLIFLLRWGIGCEIFFFFLSCGFGHGKYFGHAIFFFIGIDELNFCVAEPQESR